MLEEAVGPAGKVGGFGPAWREGSVIEPRRWFWRNSRGASGVIEVCRELRDGDEVLGGRTLPAGLPLGDSLGLLAPELAASPPFTGVEDMAEGVEGGNAARLSADIMDVRRQERVATILDNHVEQKYRPLSNPVTLPDTNHPPFPVVSSLLLLLPQSHKPIHALTLSRLSTATLSVTLRRPCSHPAQLSSPNPKDVMSVQARLR